jgi:3-oxoacyl-(acyl-carrier-protein) synthase
VGEPAFDFHAYKEWIDARFKPNRFPQLMQKMGQPSLYAIGAFVQSLAQNQGIEKTLQELGNDAQVLVGTGLGDLITQYECSLDYYYAQRRWDRFWAQPERNADRNTFEAASPTERVRLARQWGVPEDPCAREGGDEEGRERAAAAWNAFWMRRSDRLRVFLDEFDAIESAGVSGEIEAGKLGLIRHKKTHLSRLEQTWGCPTPPWRAVSANLIWNIPNTPASQISMLGRITGPAWSPVAACSTFGVCLKLAFEAIRRGEARAVVIGATDPPPHPLFISGFFQGRILCADRRPSVPLTDLRGTHLAGGACVWIVGDHEFMAARGYTPLGLEIIGVGVTSDADHIITPSEHGPQECMREALESAGISAEDVSNWDLHATATPGDFNEVKNLKAVLPRTVAVTARKGTFGHGMSVAGGWELTAQHLGMTQGKLFPCPLDASELNPHIAGIANDYVFGCERPASAGAAGKLSMGIGGINACVISRPW